MQSIIAKWGNSSAIRIPKSCLDQINMKNGDRIHFTMKKNEIIIKKDTPHLQSMLQNISESNIHKEYNTGNPLGSEIW